MNSITNLYELAKQAKAASSAAQFDMSITDEEADAIFDAECKAYNTLAAALVEFTNGKLNRKEADALVRRKFDQIGNLVSCLAA